VAAVLVHIDLDGEAPHASSLQALAAGRAVASSWGATLYAAVIARDPGPRSATGAGASAPSAPAAPPGRGNIVRIPGNARTIEAIRAALARGGADKIVVALTEAPITPLWAALGAAWSAVLDQLRPRLVAFGADAPAAVELAPRTAARIGARLLLRARVIGGEDVELRDGEGRHVRASDAGAVVAMVGAAPRLAVHGEDDIDVLVLGPSGGAEPGIELVGTAPAEVAHTTGVLIAIGDNAARDPEVAAATALLARVLGARVVGSAAAAAAGAVGPGAIIERGAPLAPDLCIAIGAPAIDVAGSTSLVRITQTGGKGADGALSGPIAKSLGDLIRALEARRA
jgi:hypothetical protein